MQNRSGGSYAQDLLSGSNYDTFFLQAEDNKYSVKQPSVVSDEEK